MEEITFRGAEGGPVRQSRGRKGDAKRRSLADKRVPTGEMEKGKCCTTYKEGPLALFNHGTV